MAHKKKLKAKTKVHPEQSAQVVVAISERFERVIAWIVWTILVVAVLVAAELAFVAMVVVRVLVLHH